MGTYAPLSSSHSQSDVPHDWQRLRDSSSDATTFARSSGAQVKKTECGMPWLVHHSTSNAKAES